MVKILRVLEIQFACAWVSALTPQIKLGLKNGKYSSDLRKKDF